MSGFDCFTPDRLARAQPPPISFSPHLCHFGRCPARLPITIQGVARTRLPLSVGGLRCSQCARENRKIKRTAEGRRGEEGGRGTADLISARVGSVHNNGKVPTRTCRRRPGSH